MSSTKICIAKIKANKEKDINTLKVPIMFLLTMSNKKGIKTKIKF